MSVIRKILSGVRAPTRWRLGVVTINGAFDAPLRWRYTSHTWHFWRWSRNSRSGTDRVRLFGRAHWRGRLFESTKKGHTDA